MTQAEANTFAEIHDALEALMAAHGDHTRDNIDAMAAQLLEELVARGELTEGQENAFQGIHDRLHEFTQAP